MKLTGQEEWKSKSGQESDVLQELVSISMGMPLYELCKFQFTSAEGKSLDPRKTLKENGVVSGTEVKITCFS